MQFLDQSASSVPTARVRLPRPDGDGPWLTISALPLGFLRQLRQHQVCLPTAPLRAARDSEGRVLRDPQGQVSVHADERDPGHQAALELYHQRMAVLAVHSGLRGDHQVRFETLPESYPTDSNAFADRLLEELEEAGWSAGDLRWLCEQICRLSNLLPDAVRGAGARFFSVASPREANVGTPRGPGTTRSSASANDCI